MSEYATLDIYPTFDDFWDLYDKKRGKPNAMKFWEKLSQKEKEACMSAIPAYLQSQPNKLYRKDPERYVRHKCWEDEIVASATGATSQARPTLTDKKQAVFDAIARRHSGAGFDTDQGY